MVADHMLIVPAPAQKKDGESTNSIQFNPIQSNKFCTNRELAGPRGSDSDGPTMKKPRKRPRRFTHSWRKQSGKVALASRKKWADMEHTHLSTKHCEQVAACLDNGLKQT